MVAATVNKLEAATDKDLDEDGDVADGNTSTKAEVKRAYDNLKIGQ